MLLKNDLASLESFVNRQCKYILESNQSYEIILGIKCVHKELAFGVESLNKDEQLIKYAKEYLKPHLPSSLVIWRVRPEFEKFNGAGPKDIDYITGREFGSPQPPKTILRMRLFIEGLKENKEEGKEVYDIYSEPLYCAYCGQVLDGRSHCV